MVEPTSPLNRVSHGSILRTHGFRTPRAYLLLHGLTASPRQFETFGRLLFEAGSNVSIPRMPRHGHADRLTTQLRELTAGELRSFATEALAEARTLGDEVVVVGFSAGGLLSAWLAQHHAVARSVSIAPFLGMAWLPDRLLAPFARVTLLFPNRFVWWHPVLRENLRPEHGYPRFSTHAVAQVATLAHELFIDAHRAAPCTTDLRLVLNVRESTVNNAAVHRLASLWGVHRRVRLRRLVGLPPSHDIIEPLRAGGLAARVYPALLDVVAA